MSLVLKQALSLFIVGCNLLAVSSFGIVESSILPLSLSSSILDCLPTQPPSFQLGFYPVFNNEIPLDFNANSHWVATASEINQSQSGNGVGQLLSEYNLLLRERPYSTKIITGMILAVAGDAIAQKREDDPYDAKRAAAFAAFDGCYRAVQQLTYPPIIAEFQGQHITAFLGSLGYTSLPVTSAVFGPLEQTLVSQLVIIPTIYYPVFFIITGIIQGLNFQETVDRAKTTFVPLMKRNLLFWIPVQFVAFAYIPQDQQIPVLIVCGLVWTVILSVSAGAINNQDEEPNNASLAMGGTSDNKGATGRSILTEEYESERIAR